jgi:hypothetical protein
VTLTFCRREPDERPEPDEARGPRSPPDSEAMVLRERLRLGSGSPMAESVACDRLCEDWREDKEVCIAGLVRRASPRSMGV